MKKLIVCAATALVLGGCGSVPATAPREAPKTLNPYGNTSVFEVDVNGRKITCIAWSGGSSGGLSCDWAVSK